MRFQSTCKSLLTVACVLLSTFTIKSQNTLDFDGMDDKINAGNDSLLQIFGNKITLEAWIYPTAWKTNVYEGDIICKEDNTNNYGYMLRCGAGGKLNFAIGNGSWNELTSSNAILTLNAWQHVAASYDGAKMRLYLNGVLTDSLSVAINISRNKTTDLHIGAHQSYTRFYQGQLDEVRIWNVVRKVSEINQSMNTEFCGRQTGMVLYYKFNQGKAGLNNSTVKTINDYSGNKFNGTLSGFSLTGGGSNWVKGKSFTKPVINASITLSKCDKMFSPSGKFQWKTSGTYYDTIPSFFNCDSAIKFILTIKKSTANTIYAYACKSYTSPSGNYVWTISGTYTEYFVNSVGCDSVLTIVLKIGGSRDTIVPIVCEKFTSPSNKYTWTKSGTYRDTLLNFRGCDSVILINLKVNYHSSSVINKNICVKYTSPSGKYTYTQTGTYKDTIANQSGCDSFIIINIKNMTSSSNLSKTVCGSWKSPSKKYTWSQTGNYKDTIRNFFGCDSVITINLTVNKPGTSSISPVACRSYVSPSKKYTYTQSGNYSDTIQTTRGCDSIIQLSLTVININKGVAKSGNMLTAAATATQYQWLDCNNQMTPISGATAQNYIATNSGRFAVEIVQNTCKDTSNCTEVVVVNKVNSLISGLQPRIVPNPNNGNFKILDSDGNIIADYVLYTIDGKEIKQNLENNASKLPNGIYIIRILSDGFVYSMKLIVQNNQ